MDNDRNVTTPNALFLLARSQHGSRAIKVFSTGDSYGLEVTVSFYVVLCCVFPKSWQLFDSPLQAALGLHRYKLRRIFSANNSVPVKSGGSGVTCCFDKPWH